jgi:hypothetical protein
VDEAKKVLTQGKDLISFPILKALVTVASGTLEETERMFAEIGKNEYLLRAVYADPDLAEYLNDPKFSDLIKKYPAPPPLPKFEGR